MKIFVDDPAVPYKTTQVNPRTTKNEIEGVLARWGIKKSGWDWDLENDKCVLEFQYTENISDTPVSQWVRVEPPHIYNKQKKDRYGRAVGAPETVNWAVSLRVLYWWLKAHLEMTYLEQYDKTTMMLPFIENAEGTTLARVLVPKITRQLLEQPSLEDLR